MKIFLTLFAITTVLIIVYAMWGRAWLKKQPFAKPFFDLMEPIELFLFKNSETILFARLKIFTGVMLAALTYLGAFDFSSVAFVRTLIPEDHQNLFDGAVTAVPIIVPLLISLVGAIDEWLRNRTTKPIELVAVNESTAPAEVKEAIEAADAVKAEAVAVVKENTP